MEIRKDFQELPSQLVGGRLQMLHDDVEFMVIVKLWEGDELYCPRALHTDKRNIEGSLKTKSFQLCICYNFY